MALSAKWKATVDDGITNTAWDDHDKTVKTEIATYNTRFKDTPKYTAVDWKQGKAMVWVESGGPSNAAWSGRVLQIGNPGDAALPVLEKAGEHSDLIMSAQLAKNVKLASEIQKPAVNIQAGLAYLFTRMAKFEYQSIITGSTVETTKVKSGEGPEKVAQRVGTTVEVLKDMNPEMKKVLQIGQELKYKAAHMEWVISGWRDFTTANIAARYNGGGDPDYQSKLDYVLDLFTKLKGR
jgi:hypothetical protein